MTQATIKNLLNPESEALGSLLTRVNQLNRWNAWLLEILPDEKKLLEHCQIVRYEQSTLFVIANNPHWSTRFKFFIPQLVTDLRHYPDFRAICSIQCKIRPLDYQKTPPANPPHQLSQENAQLFLELADKINDPTLKKIVEKIASRTR
jgi:hypothetical protein